jgi:hypothetical protein
MDRYDIGDVARLTGTFRAFDGVTLQDPGSLQVLVKTPGGVTTTYTYPASAQIVHEGTGVFHVDVDVTEPGTWRYRWVATGVGKAAEPGSFEASPDPLTDEPRATARERLALMLAADEEPTLDDSEIAGLLAQAQRADVNGLYASDAGWIPTYDLYAAAAEGWLRKAGKVSPNYSFGIDASRDMQSDVFTHCMAMHEKYTKGSSGSAKVESMIDDFDPATGYGGPLVTGFFDGPFT